MKRTVFRELVNTCILTLHVILLHNRGRASVSASFEINQLALSRDTQQSTFLSFVYPFLKKIVHKKCTVFLFCLQLAPNLPIPAITIYKLIYFKDPCVIQNILYPKLYRFKGQR